MVSRSRSSVRMSRPKSVARKSRSPARKSRSPARKSRSPARKSMRKTMRKMRSKSPRKLTRKTRRLSGRKGSRSGSRKSTRKSAGAAKPKTEFQKFRAAHKAEITAKVKAMGYTGRKFIGQFSKMLKQMAADAGVGRKMKAPKMSSTRRRARVSAVRKMKAGVSPLSQSAEQKLRALFSRSPSRYTLRAGKKGTRVALKRKSRKAPKLTKSGKPRATRRPTARNLWIKEHKAAINAELARRGMKGGPAFLKVANEMMKASM